EGFEVESAAGRSTLAELEEHRPDVVLLDYQMPGMDGIEIAREMRTHPELAEVLIVAMTAAGRAGWVCQEMGASGCLGKPFDIDELVRVVEDPFNHKAHEVA